MDASGRSRSRSLRSARSSSAPRVTRTWRRTWKRRLLLLAEPMTDHADISATAIPGRETFPPAGERGIASTSRPPLGTRLLDGKRCEFRVWAPALERVAVHIVAPQE